LVFCKLPAPERLSFLKLGEFLAITLLYTVSIALIYISSPSSTPIVHMFGLFMVS
jgi:hypothetical protein